MISKFDTLIKEVRNCSICRESLPLGPRPIIQTHPNSKILIVGQAPGIKVHKSGIPFDDASGDRLRKWMGINKTVFYDAKKISIVPMGFCYPGSKKSGDLPPRPECAIAWRQKLLDHLNKVELTLVIGQYAMKYHLNNKNVTQSTKDWQNYWPEILPLPHPSPRNYIWFKNNVWFDDLILPMLKKRITQLLKS